MECTFKKSGINNLKVLFLFHRLLYNLLEIKALRVLMETMSCDFGSCRLSRVHFCR